jgi:predicted amidohydrolase YtcJ
VNHLDDVTGSIEVGKEADLVVVDRNLFDLSLDELADAKVQMTMVAGAPVFVDPSFT